MKNKKILIIVLSFFSQMHLAFGEEATQEIAESRNDGKDLEKEKSPFRAKVSLEHDTYVNKDFSANTVLGLSASYKVEKISYSAAIDFTKLYEVNSGEKEVQISDTILSASYKLSEFKDNRTVNITPVFSLTLPTSEFSYKQKVTSVPRLSVNFSRSLLDDKLSISVTPFYAYHLNQYKTLENDDRGAYHISQRLGFNFGVGYSLPHDFSLYLLYSNQKRIYENYNNPSTHRYSFDGSLGYKILENLNATVGYNQTDLAEKLGTVDVNLYDVDVTYYYLSVAYSL